MIKVERHYIQSNNEIIELCKQSKELYNKRGGTVSLVFMYLALMPLIIVGLLGGSVHDIVIALWVAIMFIVCAVVWWISEVRE